MTCPWHTAITFAVAIFCTSPVFGRELAVGPARALKLPSQAAAVAVDGDVVRIDPGTYADCATWRASQLLIEGTGPDVLIAGRTCAGKAIFITQGANITIRAITFADAAVVSHNGAGIRAEGANLTIDHSRFLNNENGILAGGGPDSVLRISDSEFIGNGACIAACAHGVYVAEPINLLEIQRCVFLNTRTAHHIKSRARNTVIRDNRIEDGAAGTSSYLIDIPNGGNVLIQGNTMEKGRHSSNATVAVSIGSEGIKNPTAALVVRDNSFRSDLLARTIFVRANAAVPVEMSGNTMIGAVEPVSEAGLAK
jgi:hypothetical protein